MTAAVARLVVALATQSLGAHRSDWARAMTAELEAAEEDGRALRFALGCLWGAWRMLPGHAEGRFALASHTLAIGLLLPMATLLGLAAVFGFPAAEAGGFPPSGATPSSLLNAGNRAAASSLALATFALAALHLPLAWWVLDRDWRRVGAVHRMGAAIATTLTMFTACAALDATRLALPLLVLAGELAALQALARWHTRLTDGVEGTN